MARNRYKVVVTKEYWVDADTENIAHEIFYDIAHDLFYDNKTPGPYAHKVSQSTKFTLMKDKET